MTDARTFERLAEHEIHYVSPHPDDAAFSSAGLLRELSLSGSRLRLRVAFTRSAYAVAGEACGVEAITAVRRSEDEAFARFIGSRLRLEHLGFEDAPLRPGRDLDSTCDGAPFRAGDLDLYEALAASLARELSPKSALFAPLAIGHHVDHRIARSASLLAARETGATLFFYEDLPYAGHRSLTEVDRHIAAFAHSENVRLVPLRVVSEDLAATKRDALACYPSQTTDADLSAVCAHASRLTGNGSAERFYEARLK